MSFYFINPVDGDVLFCAADGYEKGSSLIVNFEIKAASECSIIVNGVRAKENVSRNGVYNVAVPLCNYCNQVEAQCEETGERQTITVFWFKEGYKTYRLGVDDVIWCFENIYQNQDRYRSIFEDPFMALFREVHQRYGTKIHMHLFYESQDGSFNLSMFPDTYKPEFIANADWLRLTFHSRAEFPDSPYKAASYEQVMREGRTVEKEIRRFASEAVLSGVTSEHWADSGLLPTRAFRDLGYKVLDGYFLFDSNGNPYVSYYLNREQTAHASQRDFWVDTRENIIFVKDDIIINEVDLDKIDGWMDALYREKNHCFMYLLIHEQYFYQNYKDFQQDYKQKVFKTVDWCKRHGYHPSWLSDIAFEKKEN